MWLHVPIPKGIIITIIEFCIQTICYIKKFYIMLFLILYYLGIVRGGKKRGSDKGKDKAVRKYYKKDGKE